MLCAAVSNCPGGSKLVSTSCLSFLDSIDPTPCGSSFLWWNLSSLLTHS
jgi:hypothetical protein